MQLCTMCKSTTTHFYICYWIDETEWYAIIIIIIITIIKLMILLFYHREMHTVLYSMTRLCEDVYDKYDIR